MTKENKLALVVGFALILFVGILISDHFSTARTQQSADLLPAEDPLVGGAQDPHLLDFTIASAGAAAASPAPLVNPQHMDDRPLDPVLNPVRQAPPQSIRTPDLQNLPDTRVALPAGDAAALEYTYHNVQPRESLTSICRRHYGDASLVRELARFNDLPDPDRVPAGARLRMPPAETLVRGDRPTATPAVLTTTTPPTRKDRATYTVRRGDVLGVIAQKTLGTSRRWRELYDANRDVIDDPDRVKVGTVLSIPD